MTARQRLTRYVRYTEGDRRMHSHADVRAERLEWHIVRTAVDDVVYDRNTQVQPMSTVPDDERTESLA